jgi:tetratricopeptide (TPR) repeat protein
MKEITAMAVFTFIFSYVLAQSGFWGEFKQTADVVHNYEYKSMMLAKELRHAYQENEILRSKIAKINLEKDFLALKAKNQSRNIASVPLQSKNDLVNFEVFKWSAEKLLGIGEKSLHFKKYEKASQYYQTLVKNYPKDNLINDKVLFQAGIAAYESKKHYSWAIEHFSAVVKKYPKSKLKRGAKLWLALSHYHTGNNKHFLKTVEEFRSKYRNTKEWAVLSKYYEDIAYKYNK